MSLESIRRYYDEFSSGYERERRPQMPEGYHALVDDLEVEFTRRYAVNKDLLECGCGTGLLLERFSAFAKTAKGIDLSPGMLERAKERGLTVEEGSVTALPFEDESFDVTCSFKVLAHVENIGKALAEMTRVTRPGGVIVAEFYNPWSVRALTKRWGPARRVSADLKESAVYTRFDSPMAIERIVPPGAAIEARYGIRIVTPVASAMKVPVLGPVIRRLEWHFADTKLAYFAGFYVVAIRKRANTFPH